MSGWQASCAPPSSIGPSCSLASGGVPAGYGINPQIGIIPNTPEQTEMVGARTKNTPGRSWTAC